MRPLARLPACPACCPAASFSLPLSLSLSLRLSPLCVSLTLSSASLSSHVSPRDDRSQLIVRTARRVTVGIGLFLYGCLGYLIFNQYRSRAALAAVWAHVIVMHGAVGWTLLCIHDYILGATIKVRAQAARRNEPPANKIVPLSSSSSSSSRMSPVPMRATEPIAEEG